MKLKVIAFQKVNLPRVSKILFGISIFFGLGACTPEEVAEEVPQIATFVTLVAGSDASPQNSGAYRAKYWVNGKEYLLTDGVGAARALGIAGISTGFRTADAYVVGYEIKNQTYQARLWKNQVPQTLEIGDGESRAEAVFIKGTDIYACGYDYTFLGAQAVYWKNGTRTYLPSGDYTSFGLSIFVDTNDDVYVAGYVREPVGDVLKNKAVYWKNGVKIYLQNTGPTTRDQDAVAIVVKNNKVYVAGNNSGTTELSVSYPVYWEDNVFGLIDNPNAVATAIAVDNDNNIFISGSKYRNGNPVAAVWKNNIDTNMEPNSSNSRVNSIFLFKNELHKAGIANAGNNTVAASWKPNDTRTNLGTGISEANSIFIVE